ncbi:conserved hypothetical protein [Alkaliphilus metalliredigens QYMF]|uniref:Cyanophage baseplate Pam3 plug gp18 domain-containing protein n=1 Tax=Alkaliphilus metalliredigens (strain QYMF) TaxID=293826 RepID=A6TKE2_ALKMQ|nr:hypothetical protein [Alkaliphilus metalliredigens]ABR46660.1 conserved hypothetical protein [Alkaliphilus metalliredigens QYMF]ABR48132.1 conserved hypothetical protein [Alkaliphilus metalliredigens QYMF]ABR50423.1 conserved hypothetical protein [Alkaliphilus metalliredigens QYMF]
MIDYISIEKNLIPYQFDIQLGGITFTSEINYNGEYDYFTIDLYKGEEVVLLGEKIVYGKPLFTTFLHLPIPPVLIVPLDLADEETRVTYENLNVKVFLYIIGDEPDAIQ